MNWADYVLIGIIAVSVLISLWRGLLKEVLGLVVWVGAAWFAFNYSDRAQGFFENSITVPSARMAVSFALVFIAALIAGGLLSFLLGKLIKGTGLSGTDRFFGMFFGFGRALVLIIAMVMAAGFTPLPKDPWWQESRLLPYFESMATWASQYLPENMRKYFLPDEDLQPPPDTTDAETTQSVVPSEPMESPAPIESPLTEDQG